MNSNISLRIALSMIALALVVGFAQICLAQCCPHSAKATEQKAAAAGKSETKTAPEGSECKMTDTASAKTAAAGKSDSKHAAEGSVCKKTETGCAKTGKSCAKTGAACAKASAACAKYCAGKCGPDCPGTCPWESGATGEAPGGWVSLFNGKDLTGWEVMGGNKEAFYVKDGAIECNGKGGGWIRHTEETSNFILRLEYKISQGGNSGVFARSQLKGNPAYTGFEVQVLDDSGRGPDKHTSGAIYDILTPMVNMSKPAGEWNEYVIICDGPLVTVLMNEVKVIDTNFDWFTKPIGKFSTAYADLPRSGYIGMQDHGNYVWYRNIWLKELP